MALTMPIVTVWLESQRVADREHDIADLERVGAAEPDLGQVGQVDLQQRQLRVRILADELRHGNSAVGQLHEDLVGVADHVPVRDDVACAIDDDAGAEAGAAHPQSEAVARHVVDALGGDVRDGGGAGRDGLGVARSARAGRRCAADELGPHEHGDERESEADRNRLRDERSDPDDPRHGGSLSGSRGPLCGQAVWPLCIMPRIAENRPCGVRMEYVRHPRGTGNSTWLVREAS